MTIEILLPSHVTVTVCFPPINWIMYLTTVTNDLREPLINFQEAYVNLCRKGIASVYQQHPMLNVLPASTSWTIVTVTIAILCRFYVDSGVNSKPDSDGSESTESSKWVRSRFNDSEWLILQKRFCSRFCARVRWTRFRIDAELPAESCARIAVGHGNIDSSRFCSSESTPESTSESSSIHLSWL